MVAAQSVVARRGELRMSLRAIFEAYVASLCSLQSFSGALLNSVLRCLTNFKRWCVNEDEIAGAKWDPSTGALTPFVLCAPRSDTNFVKGVILLLRFEYERY